MSKLPRAEDFRKPDYPIESLFVRRWSPRAMSGEPLSEKELLTLFEAARWAPSTYNEQEWRFLFARRGAGPRQTFFAFRLEGYPAPCQPAAGLAAGARRRTRAPPSNPQDAASL